MACPTFLTGKPLSLKWVNDSLKQPPAWTT
jgi:hypothetical protein